MNQASNFNPNDYMQDAKGNLVPKSKVKPLDKLRDETVRNMFDIAKTLSNDMAIVKDKLLKLFDDFCQLSAAEHNKTWGGTKGNTTLTSYDGSVRVQLAIAECIHFDERLQIAKSLIDECIHEWSAGANDNIKALINNAFQVDKQGKINTGRVLNLRRLDIADEKWLQAMQAISDSIQVTNTKEYIRFHQRDENGKYQYLPMDFSSM